MSNIPDDLKYASTHEWISVNEDGLVTKEEFAASSFSKMLKSFDVLKPNKDGVVEKKAFIEAFVKAHSKPKTEA